MLKKMRRKFILSAMAAVFTIVLILSLSVIVMYYQNATNQLDATLYRLTDSELEQSDPFSDGNFPDKGPFIGDMPEARYMTRYFAVIMDGDSKVLHTSRDYIASISEDDAANYASAVIARGQKSGFYKGYRYLVTEDEKTIVVFLNADKEIMSSKVLAVVCIVVSLICMLIAFGIIMLLSKRAVDPYMKNIERQKQFITNASHELKTPLTAIATSADVLALDDGNNEWVENIQSQVQRLSKLVNGLVALSRLDEETPLPEQEDFVLSDIIWEISEPMSALAAAKGLKFTQEIEDGMEMHGDRASIGQLVSILLENALKYTSQDGEITLHAYKKHRELILEIKNTCHIADTANINRLFERFYRPDESRTSSTGGTGIGLSIAKAIVEAHKGTITVESPNGESICFTAHLRAI